MIKQLVDNEITLEIALTSNRILVNNLHGDIHNHPIRQLYDKGVRITLNTDDAGIFGTDIEKEYQLAEQAFHFSRLELFDITLCGIDAAFVESNEKTRLLNEVLSCFNNNDKRSLQQAINTNQYHPAIIARFKKYQDLLLQHVNG